MPSAAPRPQVLVVDGGVVVTMDGAPSVAALVLGAPPPLELLLVGGRPVVERDALVTADETALTREAVRQHRRLLG